MTRTDASRPTLVPDPNRLGGLDWTRRTGGILTGRERRRLLGYIARAQLVELVGRIVRTTGAAPGNMHLLDDPPTPPDSAFAKAAETACREQPPYLIGHGYRSWIYGSGLALLDNARIDPELFYVSCLLHDFGLQQAVAGEDFTLRGAERAESCGHQTKVQHQRITEAADAITVHITPGITISRDGALGTYVQAGALLDLTGRRACDLPTRYRDGATTAYPPTGLGTAVTHAIRQEAKANPRTRLALLHGCGLSRLIRISTAP